MYFFSLAALLSFFLHPVCFFFIVNCNGPIRYEELVPVL